MEKDLLPYCERLKLSLDKCSENEQKQLLLEEGDIVLWTLFHMGNKRSLSILFRRHHKQIVLKVYQKRSTSNFRLADVQDAFGDFVEQVLAGKFKDIEIRKDFPAFASHHISFLLKERAKKIARRMALREQKQIAVHQKEEPQRQVEDMHDFHRVLDFIPKIGNRVYRMVLYLVLVEGYNSQDLTGVFGKANLAYDKKSRAIKAFRQLLSKDGIMDELK